MRNIYIIFSFIALLLLFGCISSPEVITPTTEKGDLNIVSFNLLNETPIFLGDFFNITSSVTSTSNNASYIFIIKLGDEKIYSKEFKGNQTIETELYASSNGKLNLTTYVYSKSISKFMEENLDNNEIILPLKIHSYGNYNFSSKTTNYSVISNEKIHSVRLKFNKTTEINSIGSFIRVTAPLNIDSYLYYEIVNDNDGFPGNESLFNLTIQIYKVSQNWEFLILQKKNQKFEPGVYWLNIYVDEKNFLNVACHNVVNSTNSYIGTKYGDEINWKKTDCEPYFIISSSSLYDTGLDFENRFSIFNVNLSNSS